MVGNFRKTHSPDLYATPFVLRSLRCLVRLLPVKSGLSRVTIRTLSLVRRVVPSEEAWGAALLRNGVTISVDLHDYNGWMMCLFGSADPKVVDVCRGLLRPGDCFFDIGANYGSVGLQCSDVVGESGAVHLFEPQPALCAKIRSAIQGHGLDHVYLHEVGLLDRDGEL